MPGLTFVSLMAPHADRFYQALCTYLATRLDQPVQFVDTFEWQERQYLLDHGHVDLGVICGAPYVLRRQWARPPLQLLAAPVMRAPRYRNQPVYFSDVVVRKTAAWHSFAELRGSTWAYNEPQSFSGYHVVCAQLAAMGAGADFFDQVLEVGSHAQALQQVQAGLADAAAIDSIVLAQAASLVPEHAWQLRTIESFGPFPIPPLVARADLAPKLCHALRTALLEMHVSAAGRPVLAVSPFAHFVAVSDPLYDPIHYQLERAASVRLAGSHAAFAL